MPQGVVRLGALSGSPAVALVCDLEQAGCRVQLASDGGVRITPVQCVTPELRARITAHRQALKAVLGAMDAGVQQRAERFAEQHAACSTGFLMLAEPTIAAGRCFSCGDSVERAGRCWRCALAWRLATGMGIGIV